MHGQVRQLPLTNQRTQFSHSCTSGSSGRGLLTLAGPVAITPNASAESTTFKAVIFEEVKPLHHKTDADYEGLGVDVLEQIRIQAKRRKVDYRVAKSVNDGIGANNDPAAMGFSYRISVQSCH